MARAKTPKVEDPNKLKRERAGRYVTGDGRFAVEGNSTGSWYLVDDERQNELGLPLMEGPFATLDEARDRVADIRDGATKGHDRAAAAATSAEATTPTSEPMAGDGRARRPKLRSLQGGVTTAQEAAAADELAPADKPGAGEEAAAAEQARPKAEPDEPGRTKREPAEAPTSSRRPARAPVEPDAPREPAWLERLPTDQHAQARRLLAMLERLDIDDPMLVRREIEANLPEVARSLLARRVRHEAIDIWSDEASVEKELASIPKEVRRHLRPLVEPALESARRVLAGSGSAEDGARFAWLVALRTAGAVFAAIESEGHERRVSGEPGWRLLELDGRREPTNRAITLDPSELLDLPED